MPHTPMHARSYCIRMASPESVLNLLHSICHLIHTDMTAVISSYDTAVVKDEGWQL